MEPKLESSTVSGAKSELIKTNPESKDVIKTPGGMDRYERVEVTTTGGGILGTGTYGEVYKGRDKLTGAFVALKRIRLETEDEGIPSTTLREIAVQRQLSHPNIVALLDVAHNDSRLYLIFEFVEQDLKKLLSDSPSGPLQPQQLCSYAFQLLKAIDYCHSRGVMHRDLKPHNILVSSNGLLKVTDFGLARAFVPPIRQWTHEVVTLWYRAPEILLGAEIYALPIDVWSIGVIIAEMVAKLPLLPGDSEIDELYRIFRIFGTPNEETWPGVTQLEDWNDAFPVWPAVTLRSIIGPNLSDPQCQDLLERLLQINPTARYTTSMALQHPYFAEQRVMDMTEAQNSSPSGSSNVFNSDFMQLG